MTAFIKKAKKFLPNGMGLVAMFIAYLFVTAPFFHHGFFPTADDFSVTRIDVFAQELRSGQFPVRYVQEFGNRGGYFLFNFYSPFIYILGSTYHFIGLTLVKSTKAVFLTSYLVALAGMYTLLRRYTSRVVSLLGSILFISASYLNFDVYFRGALAEFFAMSLLPWVLWAFMRLKDMPTAKSTILAGTIFALLVSTHNLTTFLFSFVLLILFFFPPYSKKIATSFLAALGVGAGISAYFWMPNLLEMRYTMYQSSWFASQSYKGNFINPLQFFGIVKIPWGFEPPFLGIGLFIGVCFSLLILVLNKKDKKMTTLGWFAVVSFIFCTIFMWDITRSLWDRSNFLKDIQFPWRIMSPATTVAVFAIGIGLEKIQKKWIQILIGILILLPAVTVQYTYLRPSGYNYIAVYKAEDECSTTTWAHELLPKWVEICLAKNNHLPLAQAVSKSVTVSNIHELQNGRKITFTTSGAGKVWILRYYFPAWEIVMDGKKVTTTAYGKYGLLSFVSTSGSHTIGVSLTSTLVEKIGNGISIGTILLVIVVFISMNYHFPHKKK